MIYFTVEQATFMVGAINGVRCTPETFIVNLQAESEFTQVPIGLFSILKSLNSSEVSELYHRCYAFWDFRNCIPNTEERLRLVGLIEPTHIPPAVEYLHTDLAKIQDILDSILAKDISRFDIGDSARKNIVEAKEKISEALDLVCIFSQIKV